MSDGPSGAGGTGGPLLRVVRGEPSAEELAALVAVVSARGEGGPAPPLRARPAWNDPARLVRGPLTTGPGAWRRSALPG